MTIVAKREYPIHRSSGVSFPLEKNPFHTLFVDVTHRCNMECQNCYIPNRTIPDMDADWMCSMLARLPRRTRIRLAGGEPTVRTDLPEVIAAVRRIGHLPVLLSNGLKLANGPYTRRLKAAGLRTVHFSMNGGVREDLYESIDDLRCVERKLKALDNLCAGNFNITVGMIVVRGVNEDHVAEFYRYLRDRKQVREFHLRNVGPVGRYMPGDKLSMPELIDVAAAMTGMPARRIAQHQGTDSNYVDFSVDGMNIQLTDWPDLGNRYRGRLTPEGRVEAMFEHSMANEGGY